jgi:hypothetical protein
MGQSQSYAALTVFPTIAIVHPMHRLYQASHAIHLFHAEGAASACTHWGSLIERVPNAFPRDANAFLGMRLPASLSICLLTHRLQGSLQVHHTAQRIHPVVSQLYSLPQTTILSPDPQHWILTSQVVARFPPTHFSCRGSTTVLSWTSTHMHYDAPGTLPGILQHEGDTLSRATIFPKKNPLGCTWQMRGYSGPPLAGARKLHHGSVPCLFPLPL